MKIITTISEINETLNIFHKEGKNIGFVPTMGALHAGHISLIQESKENNDITVTSIFVNPIQFNNKEDLDKYPNQIEKDIQMLEDVNCDILFKPTVNEMYPTPDNSEFHFGKLEGVMEGANRPGHFHGVAVVVKRLFEIIKPTKAYFGKKDFQQLLIVQSLVSQHNLSPEIIACDIVREEDGLAMSSRNKRLSFAQRRKAPAIYENIKKAKDLKDYLSPKQLKHWMQERYLDNEDFILEYFEIADSKTLESITEWDTSRKAMGFIVVHLGGVRLIDNIEL